ncbi:MAG: hypothetical protein LBL93_02295 [Ruminococcus sp.]|jgi:hypothetical protein|nr:hypothetical protein [Ruminococcus sp.]
MKENTASLEDMLPEFNFENAIKNPFTNYEKKELKIKIDKSLFNFLESWSEENDISVENIVNRMLDEYASWLRWENYHEKRKLEEVKIEYNPK